VLGLHHQLLRSTLLGSIPFVENPKEGKQLEEDEEEAEEEAEEDELEDEPEAEPKADAVVFDLAGVLFEFGG